MVIIPIILRNSMNKNIEGVGSIQVNRYPLEETLVTTGTMFPIVGLTMDTVVATL